MHDLLKFRNWKDHRYEYTSVIFAKDCKHCEQIQRNIEKNKDRPLAILKARARQHGRKHGLSFEFMWTNMNWFTLVPLLRAMMTEEGRCTSCGHAFLSDDDIEIEHREAPRFIKDFARIHARNIGLACDSCNGTKSSKPYSQWLDEQELARQSNEANPSPSPKQDDDPSDIQFTLEFT